MNVEHGQVWEDNSSRIEIEVLRTGTAHEILCDEDGCVRNCHVKMIETQELDKPKTRGVIGFGDLYSYVTYKRMK
jgi:hypothetical protein